MSQWDGVDELSNDIFKEDEIEVIKPYFEEIIIQDWVKYLIKE